MIPFCSQCGHQPRCINYNWRRRHTGPGSSGKNQQATESRVFNPKKSRKELIGHFPTESFIPQASVHALMCERTLIRRSRQPQYSPEHHHVGVVSQCDAIWTARMVALSLGLSLYNIYDELVAACPTLKSSDVTKFGERERRLWICSRLGVNEGGGRQHTKKNPLSHFLQGANPPPPVAHPLLLEEITDT